jgi:hypothetical protein
VSPRVCASSGGLRAQEISRRIRAGVPASGGRPRARETSRKAPGESRRKTAERPGGAAGFRQRRPPGRSHRTDPPLVDLRALACVSTYTSPVSPLPARRAMPRYVTRSTGCPACGPLSPIHADPVARAIGPGANRNRLTSGQLGWPQILGSEPRPRCLRSPARPVGLAGCAPVARAAPSRSPSPIVPNEPGLTRPRRSYLLGGRLLVAPVARSPVGGGRCSLSCPDVAAPRRRRRTGPKSGSPTGPVGVRSPGRGSVNSLRNPRSRGISEVTGLSTELLCYPQVSGNSPPDPHRSPTGMHTGSRSVGGQPLAHELNPNHGSA